MKSTERKDWTNQLFKVEFWIAIDEYIEYVTLYFYKSQVIRIIYLN